jgi:heme-degrading monooxygenase HmoA
MIVRRWSATATAKGADNYQRHFTQAVLPALRRLDGFQGAYVLRQVDTHDRERVMLTDLTFWDSLDAISAFSSPDIDNAVVDPTAQTHLLDFDTTVTHHHVVVDTLS